MPKLLRSPRPRGLASAGLAVLVVLAAGCSTNRLPESGQADSPAGSLLAPAPALDAPIPGLNRFSLMPLAVGNRWDYRVITSSRLLTSGSTVEHTRTSTPWRIDITGMIRIGDQDYFQEADYDPSSGWPAIPQYLVREDATGLYYRGVIVFPGAEAGAPAARSIRAQQHVAAVREAASRTPHPAAFEAAAVRAGQLLETVTALDNVPLAPFPTTGFPRRGEETGFRRGQPLPGELSMLVYPVFRGTRWIVRDSPRFTRTVEGRERLSLPFGDVTAWALRGGSEWYGPNDRVRFYYSPDGLVRIQARFESAVADSAGNLVGRLVTEMDQQLESFSRFPIPL